MTAAVILAAGQGARLGGVAKAMLVTAGRTYLETIVALARVDEMIVVVAAPFADVVGAHAEALGARVVVNPEPARGMASSIALGFAALSERSRAAWLWPVDHPHVAPATIAKLAAAFPADNDHAVVRPRFAGRGGHPPLVGRGRWAALAACALAPEGARSVLRGEDTIDVEVDDPGVVRDIDTPEDLA